MLCLRLCLRLRLWLRTGFATAYVTAYVSGSATAYGLPPLRPLQLPCAATTCLVPPLPP